MPCIVINRKIIVINMNTRRLKMRWAHLFNKEMHKFFVDKNVLDIGCLDGYSTNQFFKHNAKNVVGIDINPIFIEEAVKEYPYINFKLQDAETINNFKGIDVVSCLGLIYFLKDPINFLKNLSIQEDANTIIIETFFNTDQTYFNDYLYLLNIHVIKKIFTDNNWKISFEKNFMLQKIDNNNKNFNFGDRIILVF